MIPFPPYEMNSDDGTAMDVFHMQVYYRDFPCQFEQTYCQDKSCTNSRLISSEISIGTCVPLQEPVTDLLEETLTSADARVKKPMKKQPSRTCSTCQKTFSTLSNLKNHLLLHKDDKRSFKCKFCGKSFTQKASLQTHTRQHTGEKPFACKYCSRSFADLSSRNRHERIHSGERPYVCEDCGTSFKYSWNLVCHRKSFHTEDDIF